MATNHSAHLGAHLLVALRLLRGPLAGDQRQGAADRRHEEEDGGDDAQRGAGRRAGCPRLTLRRVVRRLLAALGALALLLLLAVEEVRVAGEELLLEGLRLRADLRVAPADETPATRRRRRPKRAQTQQHDDDDEKEQEEDSTHGHERQAGWRHPQQRTQWAPPIMALHAAAATSTGKGATGKGSW